MARRFVISGRVQGVGFRFFAREAAQCELLSGSVTNLPDGRVEVVAEGDADALVRFERQIRRGPPAARIDRVEVHAEPPTGRAGTFDMR